MICATHKNVAMHNRSPYIEITDNIPAWSARSTLKPRSHKKRSPQMNEHIKRQAEEFMNAAKAAKIPENIQAFAQEGVAKSQEAFETLTAAAKDQAKVAEDFALATQAGIKSISAKMFDNTAVNAEAARSGKSRERPDVDVAGSGPATTGRGWHRIQRASRRGAVLPVLGRRAPGRNTGASGRFFPVARR